MYEMPHYADGAYAILGRALESIVMMPYEEWVNQHIFKPLGTYVLSALAFDVHTSLIPLIMTVAACNLLSPGMDSSFMVYDEWSDLAKRVPPGMEGNFTYPSFVAQVDLRWARPTGNVRPPHRLNFDQCPPCR
jgi:hypothetical protein